MNIFFPRRMKDLTIIVHRDRFDEVIESLHESGKVEISSYERDSDIEKHVMQNTVPEIGRKLSDLEMQISTVLDIFDGLPKKEQSFMDMLRPEPIVPIQREKKSPGALVKEIEKTLEDSGKRVQMIDKEINDINVRLTEMGSLSQDIEFLGDLDVDLAMVGESDYMVVRVGKTDRPDKLEKALSSLDGCFIHLEQRDEDEYAFMAGAYIRDKVEFENALRQSEAKIIYVDKLDKTPERALKKLQLDIKKLQDDRETRLKEIQGLRDRYETKYMVIREESKILSDKVDVNSKLGKTDSTSLIKAWCPADEVQSVRAAVEQSSRGLAMVMDGEPEDPDEVPVSLKNPSFIRPYELLTNMFAPPRYNEVDPTIILAPAFIIFFGLMLSDAVYGAVVTATALTLIWGPGRVDIGIKNFGYILLGAGVSTIIFGAAQGGYMGPESADYLNLPGYFGLSSPSILNALEGDGPLLLLIISLIIGLAYINLGMVLSLVQHLQRKNYRDVLYENVSWWLLQPGGFILVGGEMFGWFEFPPMVVTLAWVMTMVGLLLLVIHARGLAFFELTGFIGDFLSFARILALALATAGIALTVNVLTDLVGSAEVGMIVILPVLIAGIAIIVKGAISKNKIIMAPGIYLALAGGLGMVQPAYMFYLFAFLVLLGGHFINLVLQALGSFVHSLRLQYVEFFGYFYEGGGSQFKPFKPERIYTKNTSNKEVTE